MAARLGNVIYWLGLVIAIPAGLLAAFMFFTWYRMPPGHEIGGRSAAILAAISLGSWLVGYAARYILAGGR